MSQVPQGGIGVFRPRCPVRPGGRGPGTGSGTAWDARAMTTVANAAPGSAGRGARTEATTTSETPADPDLQLARDPKAGAGRLMVLAGNRPDLRGVIVDNPGCSPELRTWVGRMGTASGGPGRGGRPGVEADSARADSADDVDDADDSLSLAPTGWEPSDIGLGDDPFGSVLGDPLMGSPLFDDAHRGDDVGGSGDADDADGADDGGAADSSGRGDDGTGRTGRGRRQRSSSRRTAASHTAAARTASRTAAPRTSPSRTSSPRTTAPRTAPYQRVPAPVPPGPYAQPGGYPAPDFGRPAGPVGPVGGGPAAPPPGFPGGGRGLPSGSPWVPGGVPGYPGGAQSTVPPAPGPGAGPHASHRQAGPAPSLGSSTSSVKVVGWILFVILFIILRAFTG